MGTSLTGLTPATTYDALIKVGDNGPLSGTAKVLSDGLGNDSPLAMSTTNVGVGTSSPLALLHISQASANTNVRIGNNSAYDQFIYFNGGNDFSLGMDASNSNAFVLSNASTLGTNDRLVVTTAGNVGIGTSSPTTKLMVEGTGSFGTVSNEVRLQNAGTFVSSTLNAHLINSDGTGAYNSGNLLIQPRCSSGAGVTDIIFATSNNTNTPTERFRITANGVTFNGDTATANALDDYEEGTWTISAAPSSTGTITLDGGVNAGSYTKIGRQVTVTGLAEVSSVSLPTGTAVIFSGLPFAIASRSLDYDSRIGGAVSVNQSGTSSAVSFEGFENQSSFNVNINASTISAGNQFYISFTYIV